MGGSVNPEGYLDMINSVNFKKSISLGQEVEKQAKKRPGHSAFLYQKQVISYEEFNRQANRYASFFNSQGYKKGDVVALLMDNCPEYLMVVTGLAKIGVISALINTGVRGEVLAQGINLSEARSMIIGSNFIDLYQTIAQRLRFRSPGSVYVDGPQPALQLPSSLQSLPLLLGECSEENPSPDTPIQGEDILVYLYTSGSYGARKAVPVSHQRFWMVGQQLKNFGYLDEDSIQYMCLPLYYNSGFTVCFSGMIITGSTMVIKGEFSTTRFWSDIRRYQANYFVGVGEMFRYLYSQEELENDADNPLETIICNGMWENLIEPFKLRYGIKHMIEIYGTTENVGSFFNYEEIPGICGNLSILNQRQGEVVRFNFDSSELVRDNNNCLIKCNPGMVGVLLCEINKINTFHGYVNDPQAAEAKIIRNAFSKGDAYLNTYDLMELHENDYISFVDRLGDTYRWKAKTVSAEQVADVIMKFFGPIEDASVYGVKIPGHEGRCGMAALTFIKDETMDWKRFLNYLNRRMPEHARPIFIRICQHLDYKYNLEEVKPQLQQENFDITRIKDPIFFLHPQKDTYLPLTADIYNDIMAGKISF